MARVGREQNGSAKQASLTCTSRRPRSNEPNETPKLRALARSIEDVIQSVATTHHLHLIARQLTHESLLVFIVAGLAYIASSFSVVQLRAFSRKFSVFPARPALSAAGYTKIRNSLRLPPVTRGQQSRFQALRWCPDGWQRRVYPEATVHPAADHHRIPGCQRHSGGGPVPDGTQARRAGQDQSAYRHHGQRGDALFRRARRTGI